MAKVETKSQPLWLKDLNINASSENTLIFKTPKGFSPRGLAFFPTALSLNAECNEVKRYANQFTKYFEDKYRRHLNEMSVLGLFSWIECCFESPRGTRYIFKYHYVVPKMTDDVLTWVKVSVPLGMTVGQDTKNKFNYWAKLLNPHPDSVPVDFIKNFNYVFRHLKSAMALFRIKDPNSPAAYPLRINNTIVTRRIFDKIVDMFSTCNNKVNTFYTDRKDLTSIQREEGPSAKAFVKRIVKNKDNIDFGTALEHLGTLDSIIDSINKNEEVEEGPTPPDMYVTYLTGEDLRYLYEKGYPVGSCMTGKNKNFIIEAYVISPTVSCQVVSTKPYGDEGFWKSISTRRICFVSTVADETTGQSKICAGRLYFTSSTGKRVAEAVSKAAEHLTCYNEIGLKLLPPREGVYIRVPENGQLPHMDGFGYIQLQSDENQNVWGVVSHSPLEGSLVYGGGGGPGNLYDGKHKEDNSYQTSRNYSGKLKIFKDSSKGKTIGFPEKEKELMCMFTKAPGANVYRSFSFYCNPDLVNLYKEAVEGVEGAKLEFTSRNTEFYIGDEVIRVPNSVVRITGLFRSDCLKYITSDLPIPTCFYYKMEYVPIGHINSDNRISLNYFPREVLEHIPPQSLIYKDGLPYLDSRQTTVRYLKDTANEHTLKVTNGEVHVF